MLDCWGLIAEQSAPLMIARTGLLYRDIYKYIYRRYPELYCGANWVDVHKPTLKSGELYVPQYVPMDIVNIAMEPIELGTEIPHIINNYNSKYIALISIASGAVFCQSLEYRQSHNTSIRINNDKRPYGFRIPLDSEIWLSPARIIFVGSYKASSITWTWDSSIGFHYKYEEFQIKN